MKFLQHRPFWGHKSPKKNAGIFGLFETYYFACFTHVTAAEFARNLASSIGSPPTEQAPYFPWRIFSSASLMSRSLDSKLYSTPAAFSNSSSTSATSSLAAGMTFISRSEERRVGKE